MSRFRIFLSLILFYDWITRVLDFNAFYSEQGILPLHSAITYTPPGSWSLYFLSPNDILNLSLWGVHALLIFCLLIGWRTTVVTPLVWIFTYSMQQRNTYINQGGDTLILLILAGAVFLPWGAHYSLDERKKRPVINVTLAHVWLTVGLASMYLFTALLKTSDEWRVNGFAVERVLQIHQLRTELGEQLHEYTNLNQMLSWLVCVIEWLIPCFLLIPIGGKKSKQAAMWLMLLLHVGIALCLRVGLFPWINLALALACLGPQSIFTPPAQDNTVVNALFIFLLSLSLFVNLTTLPNFGYQPIQPLKKVAQMMGLTQDWGMFSPGIIRKDGWHSAQVLLANGGYQPFEFGLNANHIAHKKLTDRWRKFSENMQKSGQSFLTTAYCQYLLRQYNTSTTQKSTLLLLYFNEVEYLNNGQFRVKPSQVISACHE